MEDNVVVFLGRFHPLVVHLPIGILLLAGLMQIISLKSKNYAVKLNPAISFTLFWGGISSLGAILIGWLLSLQGGYDIDTLFWHKWLGILLTFLTFFAYFLKSSKIKFQNYIFYTSLSFIILLVGITGHLGGNLTHGDTYLVHYAPNIIKKIMGIDIISNNNKLANIHQDSIQVFAYFVQPILEKKCISCHNSNKKEGGLLLDSYEEIFKGGDNGSVINTKDAYKSELLNRVTLPKSHEKFMPPRGNPLTSGEIQIMEWWMKNGADSISRFANAKKLESKLIYTLLRDYNLDYNTKAYYEKAKVDSLSSQIITALVKNQFTYDFMGESNNFISITYQGDSIKISQMEKLLLAKEQITWLNLSNCHLTDELMSLLKEFSNLTRLNLHSNPITDEGIKYLLDFDHLNSLNIYNTNVSNESLEKLVQLPTLSKLYVWKTAITSDQVKDASDQFTHIEIVSKLN